MCGLSALVVQIPKVAGQGNVVRLHLRDGRTLSAQARGERAFDQDFIIRKFTQSAGYALRPAAIQEIIDIIAHIAEQRSIDRLMTLARGG